MTLEETADLLRVGPEEIRTLPATGAQPARRLGKEWRLSRTAVLMWLSGDGAAL
ncbi:MAG: helix-turn-helix domain-containing protein [Candidatus Dormibacteria bacterium]|jgi:excisionase family DNA binding protein